MKVYPPENGCLVIKSWCDAPENGAVEQAKNLARLPFVFKQICLMPDTHQGYGMPIGGVMATDNVVVPNAVGVDIGCGMCAVQSSLENISVDDLKIVLGKIREQIPLGFNRHKESQDYTLMPAFENMHDVCEREYTSALNQLGTLGGGNHFIEVQKGSDGHVWVMIHSGSRNLGKQVADHYNKKAEEINAKYYSSVPKEWELAFLPFDCEDGRHYMAEMQYCVDFALANRKLMMTRVEDIIKEVTQATFGDVINIAHNYARMESHFGKNVLIHRKGATSAREGEIGIVPGSQGTLSYIVQGLGSHESFQSCSHGAGRKMGRKQAQRTLNLDEEKSKLDSQGILHAIRGVDDLDEASGAYKSIDVVMKEQEDLVKPVVELRPLAVVKG